MAYRGHHYAIHEEDDYLPDYMGVDFALGKRAKGKGELADGDAKARPSREASVASTARAASKSRSETGSSKGHGKQKGGDHSDLVKALEGAKGHATIEAVLKAFGMGAHSGNGKGKGEKKESKPMRNWKLELAQKWGKLEHGETGPHLWGRVRKAIDTEWSLEEIDKQKKLLETKLESALSEVHTKSRARKDWLIKNIPKTLYFWSELNAGVEEHDTEDDDTAAEAITAYMKSLQNKVETLATYFNSMKTGAYTVKQKILSMKRKEGDTEYLTLKSYEVLCQKWVLRNSKRFIKLNFLSAELKPYQDQYLALCEEIHNLVVSHKVRELSAQLSFVQALEKKKREAK